MQRDFESHLWDVVKAIDQIDRYSHNATLEKYLEDDFLQGAVERRLQIIGDSLNKADEFFPGRLESIPKVRQLIAFRNRLVHAYFALNNQIVWELTRTELPILRAAVIALLPPSN